MPVVVVAGLIALAVAWLGIVYFAEPWGQSALPSGMDARCDPAPSLSNPYLNSTWTDQIAYLYSPAFLQILPRSGCCPGTPSSRLGGDPAGRVAT